MERFIFILIFICLLIGTVAEITAQDREQLSAKAPTTKAQAQDSMLKAQPRGHPALSQLLQHPHIGVDAFLKLHNLTEFPAQTAEGRGRIMALCDTIAQTMHGHAELGNLYDGMVADAASLDPPLTLISREEVAELEGGELDKQFCEGAAHLGFHHHMQKSQEWIVRLFLKYTATLSDDAKIQEVQESATGAFGLELLDTGVHIDSKTDGALHASGSDGSGCTPAEWINDGWCDGHLNNKDCDMDGGDCCSETCRTGAYSSSWAYSCSPSGFNCLSNCGSVGKGYCKNGCRCSCTCYANGGLGDRCDEPLPSYTGRVCQLEDLCECCARQQGWSNWVKVTLCDGAAVGLDAVYDVGASVVDTVGDTLGSVYGRRRLLSDVQPQSVELFNSIDTSGDGQLLREELLMWLKNLPVGLKEMNITQQKMDLLLKWLDLDNDGAISQKEWAQDLSQDRFQQALQDKFNSSLSKLEDPAIGSSDDLISLLAESSRTDDAQEAQVGWDCG